MHAEMIQEMPAVFCGPMADAAYFVALAFAILGLYSMVRLLKPASRSSRDDQLRRPPL